MCGIVGVYSFSNGEVCPNLVLAMAGELLHRGPDGTSLYLDGPFVMANTRLSIIDIDGGDQPIGSESGRYWVMQNGEIFNFPELQAELQSLGHQFRTRCDTEVLVHAFEEWGEDSLHRLNGDFAFAIWDRLERSLFLARDRFGIKPLFIAEFDGDFCFASETKALLRHPRAIRELETSSIVDVFTIWTTMPDRTVFKGIRELPPGHYLYIKAGEPQREGRWWTLPFAQPQIDHSRSKQELSDELLNLLEDATRIRLRADVPVGLYVSGGLDSSIAAALTRRLTSSPISGFGIGFSDRRYDESVYQENIASWLDIDFCRINLNGAQIAEAFPRVIDLVETPILRTSPAPLLYLSALASQKGFKVVLTGEGADELFAGYNIFRETMVRLFWARQPDSKIRPLLLRKLYGYLPASLSVSQEMLGSFFGQGLSDTRNPLYSHWIRFENTKRILRFIRPEVLEAASAKASALERLTALLPEAFLDLGPLSRAQFIEIQTFMQGYLLHSQGDRMLMGNSVEGRFPYLDHRLAELAARIPENLRLRGMKEKFILREAVSSILPRDILAREKRPYRAPILKAFFGDGAPDYVADILSPGSVEASGIFLPSAVSSLVRKCQRAGGAGVSETDEMALVGILSTLLIQKRLVANPTACPLPVPGRVVVGSD